MSETTEELLAKVEDALWIGDQRTAGLLLHTILLQDFTNREAWQLLHSIRGGEQPLKEFQRSFSLRYYPNLAYLLDEPPPDLGEFLWSTPPGEPLAKASQAEPLTPMIDPILGEPDATAGEPAEDDQAESEEEEAALEPLKPLIPADRPLFEVPEPVVRSGLLELVELDFLEEEADERAGQPAMRNEICPGCGVTLNGDEISCAYCGIDLAKLLGHTPQADEAPLPASQPTCPTCGKVYPAEAQFCGICGEALVYPGEIEPAPEAPAPTALPSEEPVEIPAQALPQALEVEEPVQVPVTDTQPKAPTPVIVTQAAAADTRPGTLTITRENSFHGALFKYTISVDGQERGKIGNNQRIEMSLAAGKHTVQFTRGTRASQSVTINLNPGENKQLYCQPPKIKGSGPRATLLSASRPVPVKNRWCLGFLLLLLIFACIGVGIGTLVYYFLVV